VTVEESVVPATMFTGEVTVAPLAGVQMVTDGLTVLSVQGAAKAGNAIANSANKIVKRRSVLIGGPQSEGLG
jgi:hypothetical protein